MSNSSCPRITSESSDSDRWSRTITTDPWSGLLVECYTYTTPDLYSPKYSSAVSLDLFCFNEALELTRRLSSQVEPSLRVGKLQPRLHRELKGGQPTGLDSLTQELSFIFRTIIFHCIQIPNNIHSRFFFNFPFLPSGALSRYSMYQLSIGEAEVMQKKGWESESCANEISSK